MPNFNIKKTKKIYKRNCQSKSAIPRDKSNYELLKIAMDEELL